MSLAATFRHGIFADSPLKTAYNPPAAAIKSNTPLYMQRPQQSSTVYFPFTLTRHSKMPASQDSFNYIHLFSYNLLRKRLNHGGWKKRKKSEISCSFFFFFFESSKCIRLNYCSLSCYELCKITLQVLGN